MEKDKGLAGTWKLHRYILFDIVKPPHGVALFISFDVGMGCANKLNNYIAIIVGMYLIQ